MCGLRRQLVAEDPRRSRSPNPLDVWILPPVWQYGEVFVRKLTRPPSRLPLALPSTWKTSCLHSKRIMHGRESCDASPLRSSRNQARLLIYSWYKTVQNSLHLPYPMSTFWAFLADQPQCFALIFSIAEVPPVALLRSGSKVKDVTLHIRREVVLCWWMRLFAQQHPNSESCASPSVNDPPFSSVSAANYGLVSSKCHSTWVP